MLYKFKCKACADVIMLGPQGDQALRFFGREPAAKGIIEVAAMSAALRALNAALTVQNSAGQAGSDTVDEPAAEVDVGLRQRLWPLMEMLRQALAAGEPIVWGV